ncbi:MAG: 50S ribosomal protein L23 [Candidatus Parcubacteria bacterium]|nr:50S ribosomal protein L23 [Candidatus Parcubacteria bacterium]
MSLFDRIKKKIRGTGKKKESSPAAPFAKVTEAKKGSVAAAKKERVKTELKKEEKKQKHTTLKLKAEEKAPVKEIKDQKVKKEGSKDAYRVLIKPLVTEKATHLVTQNKYSFAVNKSANKIVIKKAIENLYGVKPLRVNIINARGKYVKSGRTFGKKKNWKKAVVTLKPGDKIEIYEGV